MMESSDNSEGREAWVCIYIQQKCLAPTALVNIVFKIYKNMGKYYFLKAHHAQHEK